MKSIIRLLRRLVTPRGNARRYAIVYHDAAGAHWLAAKPGGYLVPGATYWLTANADTGLAELETFFSLDMATFVADWIAMVLACADEPTPHGEVCVVEITTVG